MRQGTYLLDGHQTFYLGVWDPLFFVKLLTRRRKTLQFFLLKKTRGGGDVAIYADLNSWKQAVSYLHMQLHIYKWVVVLIS